MGGGAYGIPAKRRQIEQNFLVIGIGKSWWAFDWYKSQPVTHKIVDLKIPPSNYGQTVAVEQHFELMGVVQSL